MPDYILETAIEMECADNRWRLSMTSMSRHEQNRVAWWAARYFVLTFQPALDEASTRWSRKDSRDSHRPS